MFETTSMTTTTNVTSLTLTSPCPADLQTDSGGDELMTSRLHYVSYGVLAPLVAGSGVINNVITLAVLRAPRFQKHATFRFLRFMAFSDLAALLFLLSIIPHVGYGVSLTPAYAFYYAHVIRPTINTCFSSSALLVVCLTLERHVAVCHPMAAGKVITTRTTRLLIGCCYAIPLVLYSPQVLQYRVGDDGVSVTWSQLYTTFWYQRVYQWTRVTLLNFLPIVTTVLLTFITVLKFRRVSCKKRVLMATSVSLALHDRGKVVRHRPRRSSIIRWQEDQKLIALLTSVSIVYTLCLTPMAFLYVFDSPELELDFRFQVFRSMANVLEVLNSSLNFFMYCLVNRDFRRQLARLPCLGCRRDRLSPAATAAVRQRRLFNLTTATA